jgi:peptidoglycan/xylan/chitin deacetylase (PgdA/CDA1 family)
VLLTLVGALVGTLLAFAAVAVTPDSVRTSTSVVAVTVGGRPRVLPAGATFDAAVHAFSLWPKPGNLLDVQGGVIQQAEYPGRVYLDGHIEDGNPLIAQGDALTMANGHDRTERTETEVVDVPGGRPGDPQFFLGDAPGQEIITKGKLSGKVLSTVFHTTGPIKRPPSVALTFDDGPWPGQTQRILQILLRFSVPATFFVIGEQASAHPDLVRQEAEAGMLVGNHSWDHPNSPPFHDLPRSQITNEIARTNRELTAIGVNVGLFRPPGGSYSSWMIHQANQMGDRLVLWSVDPRDWQAGRTARQIVHIVLANVRPGSIILLHDGGGDRSATIAALPRIIRRIRKMDLRFVSVEDNSG